MNQHDAQPARVGNARRTPGGGTSRDSETFGMDTNATGRGLLQILLDIIMAEGSEDADEPEQT